MRSASCNSPSPAPPATIADRLADGVDVVVHNAGVTRDRTIAKMPADRWSSLMEINLSSEERINDERELAVADRVLAERRELAITAARISPPTYIASELGGRPSDPSKAKVWDRAVSDIEGFRQRHGVSDPKRALGHEHRQEQTLALQRIQQAQRVLDLGYHAAKERGMGCPPTHRH